MSCSWHWSVSRTFSNEAMHDQSMLKAVMSFISSSQQNTGQMAISMIFCIFINTQAPESIHTSNHTETSDMEMSCSINGRLLNLSVEE